MQRVIHNIVWVTWCKLTNHILSYQQAWAKNLFQTEDTHLHLIVKEMILFLYLTSRIEIRRNLDYAWMMTRRGCAILLCGKHIHCKIVIVWEVELITITYKITQVIHFEEFL